MRKEKKIPLWLKSNVVKDLDPAVLDADPNNEVRPHYRAWCTN